MKIFDKSPYMWENDQKSYQRILKKVDPKNEIEILDEHMLYCYSISKKKKQKRKGNSMKRTFTITVTGGKTNIKGEDMTLAEASGILNYFFMRKAMDSVLKLEEVQSKKPTKKIKK